MSVSRTQRSDAGEARTHGTLVSSQALSHCAPILLVYTDEESRSKFRPLAALNISVWAFKRGYQVPKSHVLAQMCLVSEWV